MVFKEDRERKLTLIGRSRSNNSEKELETSLKEIHERFIKRYSTDVIGKWNGDLAKFSEFVQELK